MAQRSNDAKDFEDIVYVLNSCPDLVKQIQSIDDEKVKLFLKTEFSALIERMNIREEIESSPDERSSPSPMSTAIKMMRNI